MNMLSYLALPLLSLLGAIVGVASGTCKLGCAALGLLIFNLLYILLMAFIVGLFSRVRPMEAQRGPYTYYYREYQSGYHEAVMSFFSLFTPAQCQTIMEDKGVAHLGLYWDDPRSLVNPNLSRSCMGLALTAQASAATKAILAEIEMKEVELPKWTAIEASMKVWVEMTYAVAPMKLIGPVCDYAMQKYPTLFKGDSEEGAMYELCLDNHTIYGLPVTEVRDIFKRLTPYKPPALTEAAKQQRQRMTEQTKKTQ